MAFLSAVRSALRAMESSNSAIMSQLIENNKLNPLKGESDPFVRRCFGKKGSDAPALGQAVSSLPVHKIPSLALVRDFCLRELPEVRGFFGEQPVYFAPAGEDETDEAQDSSMQLLQALANGTTTPETMVNFPSKSLDDLRFAGGQVEAPQQLLRATPTKCTVFSLDTIVPLQHSDEGTTTSTLLHGEMIWIIWPPTPHNLSLLTTAYSTFTEPITLNIAQDLEGGFTYLLSAGEALRVPPFCPMMGLASKTSVLATHSTVTVSQFLSTLRHIDLLRAWFLSETDLQFKVSSFNTALLRAFDTILNGNFFQDAFVDLPHAEHIPDLLSMWDEVKEDVFSFLGSADVQTMRAIWSDYLVKRGRICAVCGKRPGKGTKKDMKKHFFDKHWVKKVQSTRNDTPTEVDAMDSVMVVDKGEGESRGGAKEILVIDDDEEQDGKLSLVGE